MAMRSRSPSRGSSNIVYREVNDQFATLYNQLSNAVQRYNRTFSSHPIVHLLPLSDSQPRDRYWIVGFSTAGLEAVSGFVEFFRSELHCPGLDISFKAHLPAPTTIDFTFKIPREIQKSQNSSLRIILILIVTALVIGSAVFFSK